MIKYLYSIFDERAKVYNSPTLFMTDEEATRWFNHVINDKQKNTVYQLFPLDFTLYNVGSFNDSDGAIVHIKSDIVVRGVDVYVPVKEDK